MEINTRSITGFLFSFCPVLKQVHDLIGATSISRLGLTSLPPEILVEIMKVIDWHALLKIRQTCRYLDDLSRTRMVWQGQYHQYVVGCKFPVRLEVPSELYSVEELERWVLARRQADLVWRRGNVMPVRERKIDDQEVGAVCLVPGGRWLLVGDLMCGSVTVYDLDAQELAGEPLIPQGNLDEQAVDRFAITVDSVQKSPNLAFTMALSTSIHMEEFLLHITTWRVTLVGDKNNACLVAQRLHSFHAHNHCLIPDIALQDNIFARTVCRGDFCYLEVFDLEHSSSEEHCKAVIFPGVVVRRIRILPGHRLLAISEGRITIFQFKIIRGVTPIAPDFTSVITEPTWHQDPPHLNACHSGLSRGISHGPAMHFLFTEGNRLLDLIFHINDDQNPQLVEVAELTHDKLSPSTCVIGFNKAFIQFPDLTVAHLTLTWDDQMLSGPKLEAPIPPTCTLYRDYSLPSTPWTGTRAPKLDEETGLILQDTKNVIWIIDTVLP